MNSGERVVKNHRVALGVAAMFLAHPSSSKLAISWRWAHQSTTNQLEFEKIRGAQRISEIGAGAEAAWNVGAIETLRKAVRTQGEKTGVRWADALSCSVRPVITYWFMALYCAAKTAAFAAAVTAGAGWGSAVLHAWTEADQALWASD